MRPARGGKAGKPRLGDQPGNDRVPLGEHLRGAPRGQFSRTLGLFTGHSLLPPATERWRQSTSRRALCIPVAAYSGGFGSLSASYTPAGWTLGSDRRLPSWASTVTSWPGRIWPSSSIRDRGLSTSRWIVRRNGRAPNSG